MNRQEKLIAEIHAEFDTAQDRLLSQANAILSKPIDATQSAVESIGERLAKVGFTNTPTVKKANEIKERKGAEIKKVVETREQAELIQYYQSTYPFLKFLTEAELDRICKKYNLVYAPSDRYTEEVPEKNLRDIETAQSLNSNDLYEEKYQLQFRDYEQKSALILMKAIGKSDMIFSKSEARMLVTKFTTGWDTNYYLGKVEHIQYDNNWLYCIYKSLNRIGSYSYQSVKTINKKGLFIAAPETHFNTEGLKKKGLGFFQIFETEIKDPIVFRYVRGGIQVLTKWGLEANDPDLVVPKLN